MQLLCLGMPFMQLFSLIFLNDLYYDMIYDAPFPLFWTLKPYVPQSPQHICFSVILSGVIGYQFSWRGREVTNSNSIFEDTTVFFIL